MEMSPMNNTTSIAILQICQSLQTAITKLNEGEMITTHTLKYIYSLTYLIPVKHTVNTVVNTSPAVYLSQVLISTSQLLQQERYRSDEIHTAPQNRQAHNHLLLGELPHKFYLQTTTYNKILLEKLLINNIITVTPPNEHFGIGLSLNRDILCREAKFLLLELKFQFFLHLKLL